ncbi:MAG TPA: UDP-3-O-acyl-N-acetylglucosamine deacetylase [Gemmatimonadales bacterium]|nr:UDP-3-O-acyl-N-acetylglucosamine deacetylase [Gemmatimonadales bacterium]
MRRTVARPAELSGTGLHTGASVRLRVEPARAGTGVRFVRGDLGGREIPAGLAAVTLTDRRTTLRTGAERIDTVEHLLAAVYAAELHDLRILLDGPEVPILDGSFAPFVALLEEAGVTEQEGRVRQLWIDRPLEVEDGTARYEVRPATGLTLDLTLEYAEPVIGRQRVRFDASRETFQREIAPARTFGFLDEVEPLRQRGLLAGASAGCAMVLSPVAVLNTVPRWPDEFARHKLGDLLGDLSLLEARLNLEIVAQRPSHRGNLTCGRALARAARFTEE